MRNISLYIASFIAIVLGSNQVSAFEHKVKNVTPFRLRTSMSYKWCDSINAQIIPPGQTFSIKKGVCQIQQILVWRDGTDGKQAATGARWAKDFSGDGVWTVKYGPPAGKPNADPIMQIEPQLTNVNKIIGDAIVNTAEDFGNQAKDLSIKAGDWALKEIVTPGAAIVGNALESLIDLFDKQTYPPFCYTGANYPRPPAREATIDDATVKKQDKDNMIPLIKKYSPIIYLEAQEKAFPIAAPEYYTGAGTELRSLTNQTLRNATRIATSGGGNIIREMPKPQTVVPTGAPVHGKPPAQNTKPAQPADELENVVANQVIIAKGGVTMKKIYDLSMANPAAKFYYSNPECITRGSNPDLNRNGKGILNTPAYVQAFTLNGKIYIRYIFHFGFNAPYPIKGLLGIVKSRKEALAIANAHVSDVEHITCEIEGTTLKRIYFGSHGSTEGFWLDADNKVIQWEGTHPVVFIARGGHGAYPEQKVYMRIYGFANDITGKGIRWEPELVFIPMCDDARLNPNIHGWTCTVGQLSIDGIGPIHVQFRKDLSGDAGDPKRPYTAALKCPNGDTGCILSLEQKATPPD